MHGRLVPVFLALNIAAMPDDAHQSNDSEELSRYRGELDLRDEALESELADVDPGIDIPELRYLGDADLMQACRHRKHPCRCVGSPRPCRDASFTPCTCHAPAVRSAQVQQLLPCLISAAALSDAPSAR